MKLYLVQHGDALDKSVDSDRPLSETGIVDVQRLANFLMRAGIHVDQIFHSGKTRAQQTAEHLAKSLSHAPIKDIAMLDPNDPLPPILEFIQTRQADTLLVGHLPFMQRLTSSLLNGNETCGYVFKPGTIVCLELSGDTWSLNWMLRPDLLDA